MSAEITGTAKEIPIDASVPLDNCLASSPFSNFMDYTQHIFHTFLEIGDLRDTAKLELDSYITLVGSAVEDHGLFAYLHWN